MANNVRKPIKNEVCFNTLFTLSTGNTFKLSFLVLQIHRLNPTCFLEEIILSVTFATSLTDTVSNTAISFFEHEERTIDCQTRFFWTDCTVSCCCLLCKKKKNQLQFGYALTTKINFAAIVSLLVKVNVWGTQH